MQIIYNILITIVCLSLIGFITASLILAFEKERDPFEHREWKKIDDIKWAMLIISLIVLMISFFLFGFLYTIENIK